MRIQNGILLTMEGERFEKGYVGRHAWRLLGQLHCHRWEAYHSGYASFLFRASAAILLASRARRQVRPHLFRRKAVGCRQGDPPRKAGQHRAGEKLASIFLCYRPFVLRAFW